MIREMIRPGGMFSPMIRSMIQTIRRYFTNLLGVNQYWEFQDTITFAGDFEFEVEFSTTTTTFDRLLSSELAAGNSIQLIVNGSNGDLFAEIDNGTATIFPSPSVSNANDGKIHTAKLRFESATNEYFVSLDGGSEGSGILAGVTNSIKVAGRNGLDGMAYYKGIIANPKFTDLSPTVLTPSTVLGQEEVTGGDFNVCNVSPSTNYTICADYDHC